ncbi:MAG: transposase, partial [Desulfosporosinus sp.]|nr:transposase [Desulfosporosinus sp.]
MKTLAKPHFRDLPQGECAGVPILLKLWDRFDFSLLLTQTGINKLRGVPTWMTAFLYIVGLISHCTSVSKMAEMAGKDALLRYLFQGKKIIQSTMSRFLTTSYNWSLFGEKRVARLQDDLDTQLHEGDVIALDDTLNPHPFGKELPFLCWLFDHSKKLNVWTMNLVTLHAVLRNGLEYPLFYRIWRKPEVKGEGPTKFDLAIEMLVQLRKSESCRLWVAMDRWYLSKDFFNFLTSNSYDWVTKAKRNTAIYRRVIKPWSGKEHFVSINARMLIQEIFPQLKLQGPGLVSVAVPDIYMKMPYKVTNKKGKVVTKQRFTPIAAVVAMNLKEDEDQTKENVVEADINELAAEFRGAYLIISNRHDTPREALSVYDRRWRIEVFYRAAKQELGLCNCHSTMEVHHHAHLELLFATETLLNYAQWYENKGKTSDG